MKILKYSLTTLFVSALLLSCDKGNAVVEEIAVTPSSISAAADKNSYSVDLVSNVLWTAVVEGEGGSDASWIELTKSKGTGDAVISFRIGANKYASERKAVVTFTTAGGKTAQVTVTQAAKEGGEEVTSVKVRLGSYNLRMSTLDNDSADNKWDVRKERLKVSIEENKFDIAGLQEVSSAMQTWLRSTFGATYDFFFFSPYTTVADGSGDKAQGIMFKKALFTISDKHFFWASNTPDVSSVNDTGTQGSYRRGGHCAVFTHKATGISLFFMNTHGCLNDEPNEVFAHVYSDKEKEYNVNSLPSFFVGDLNAAPGDAPVKTYKNHWFDSFEKAAKSNASNAVGTYNGFSASFGKSRIDYVFFRGAGVTVNEFYINNSLYDGKFASDHFPVWADVTINK